MSTRCKVVAAVIACLGCRASKRDSSASPTPAPSSEANRVLPAATDGVRALPDAIPGFTAEALIEDPAFVRRTYLRGGTRISVTLARFPMTSEQYAQWVRASREGYPQAALVVPDELGNGFYECAATAQDHCALLIQLRSGLHVEIRGDGSTLRRDVDAIAQGLALGDRARGGAP